MARARQLSRRYLSGRQLPDKAVDLLDTATARVKMAMATKPEGMGTGLGLAVSRSLVREHGGQLGVEISASGAVFRMSLPISGQPTDVTEPGALTGASGSVCATVRPASLRALMMKPSSSSVSARSKPLVAAGPSPVLAQKQVAAGALQSTATMNSARRRLLKQASAYGP